MAPADRNQPIIVFSDLDGTLLDHETYSWSDAKPALEKLKERGASLVLASSKTAAEIITLRTELGFEHCPAIVENGGGLLAANAKEPAETTTHRLLIEKLTSLPASLRGLFTGFSDMSIEEIVKCTGLTKTQAINAANRQFTEPGLFSGSQTQREQFVATLQEIGISARMGGRFLTLSFGQNKSLLMQQICLEVSPSKTPLTIALGDAPNDLEMLIEADQGFLIPNPAGSWQSQMTKQLPPSVTAASQAGPAGWNLSVLSVIDEETVE